jgi:lysophospholipase L1-like esterase
MKLFILVLAILLTACSLAVPRDVPQTDVPQLVTDVPAMTQSPALDVTSTPPVDLPPASALPAGPISMVALGDSLTQGDGDDSGRGYPGRVLNMVNAVRPGSTLTNLGQSGWNSDALINGDQGIESQLTRAVKQLQSVTAQGRGAVAFVWIGSNDLWYLYEYGEGSDENDASDAAHFSSNMDTILGQLHGKGAQVIVALLDDQSKRPVALKGEAYTATTPDELNRMSAQVVRYNQIIVEKAAQYGALTVDFHATDIFTNPATLYEDGNHPNQAGYDVIAQKWFEVLSSIL